METVRTRHNLPAEPNDFVGRHRDLAELKALLSASRVVTLCGVGGIGKSRLALRLAAGLLDEFDDGVWLVELAHVTRPELVAQRVADALGIGEEPGRTRQETVVEALRHRRMLLILDNCEHLIEACADLGTLLVAASPRPRLLTTSREPLRIPGESVWRVPPLELARKTGDHTEIAGSEAVELFARRAMAARPRFAVTPDNAEQVAKLCRDLDGIPLAIELAAARVGVLSIGQISERLADRFRLLTSGDRTAPARQQTLRATVDWSFELLDEQERILLSRFSVFSGGWTLEMAEEICSDAWLPREQVLDLLAALVDKSLVTLDREVAGELRYRLLETVRIYAAERLTENGEEPLLRRRHCDYFITLTERFYAVMLIEAVGFRERVELGLRLIAEQDNVRSALSWCVETNEAELGLRIAYGLRSFWGYHGLFAEERTWLERLLALDLTRVPDSVRGASLVTLADAALELGELSQVREPAEAGLHLTLAAGETRYSAHARHTLGLLALFEGHNDDAEALLTEALHEAHGGGDAYRESLVAGSLGVLAAARGRLQTARRWYETALRVAEGITHQWVMSQIHLLLGGLEEQRGDQEAALRSYEESLSLLSSYRSLHAAMPSLIGIARIAIERGDYATADARLRESLRISQTLGNRVETARSLEAAAMLAHGRGLTHKAVRVLAATDSLRDSLGHLKSADVVARADQILATARGRLGDQAVAQLLAEGRAMTATDAVEYAIEEWDDEDSPESPQPHHPAPSLGPLTARETEIATLVARGLTNRGIAEELVISPATAARHVANILTKLGYNSRAQIAHWAAQHGLTS